MKALTVIETDDEQVVVVSGEPCDTMNYVALLHKGIEAIVTVGALVRGSDEC